MSKVKCHICGEEALYSDNYPIQYHDCKPVPGAHLDLALAEIDTYKNKLRYARYLAHLAHNSLIKARAGSTDDAWKLQVDFIITSLEHFTTEYTSNDGSKPSPVRST